MCFFTQQTKSAKEVENRFNAKIKHVNQFDTHQKINGFTFPKTPVITHQNIELIQHFQWGLIPSWAKEESFKKNTLNARIETLNEKPSFKNINNNRCLVIADGFYEWQWEDSKGKNKQPYLITFPNHELFSFAGIWSEWLNNKTGELINSYSIITTEADKFMSVIHNSKKRMPVILPNSLERDWLLGAPLDQFKSLSLNLKAQKI